MRASNSSSERFWMYLLFIHSSLATSNTGPPVLKRVHVNASTISWYEKISRSSGMLQPISAR